mmetsp:Transcript_32545/g.87365  ORF Transcript_32545/g.87365 Transcript_32545/m.87365 type:complete len:231 (-) Transcript_32545:716-1408(-)
MWREEDTSCREGSQRGVIPANLRETACQEALPALVQSCPATENHSALVQTLERPERQTQKPNWRTPARYDRTPSNGNRRGSSVDEVVEGCEGSTLKQRCLWNLFDQRPGTRDVMPGTPLGQRIDSFTRRVQPWPGRNFESTMASERTVQVHGDARDRVLLLVAQRCEAHVGSVQHDGGFEGHERLERVYHEAWVLLEPRPRGSMNLLCHNIHFDVQEPIFSSVLVLSFRI